MEPRERFVELALSFVGTKEVGGANRGPQVEAFQKAVDGKAEGEPWCLAMVQYCAIQVEREYGLKTKLHRTEHVLTAYNKHPLNMRHKEPAVGRLVVWQFYKDGKATPSGHVGIVTGIDAKGNLLTVEGNTGSGAGVVREGDGVYKRVRSPKGSATMKVRGYLEIFV